MAEPWLDAGYRCYCIDIKHPQGITEERNLVKVGADLMDWLPPKNDRVKFSAWFPPCTHVAVSGARWFPDKGLGGLIEALTLFDRAVKLAEWLNAPYLIENPVSMVSSYWRKPDYIFDPWDYGDNYPKRTCLWTGHGFKMPEITGINLTKGIDYEYIHNTTNFQGRSELRSRTPKGFAEAVFRENHNDS